MITQNDPTPQERAAMAARQRRWSVQMALPWLFILIFSLVMIAARRNGEIDGIFVGLSVLGILVAAWR